MQLNSTNNSGYTGTMIVSEGQLQVTTVGAFGSGTAGVKQRHLELESSAVSTATNATIDVKTRAPLTQAVSNSWNGNITGANSGVLTFSALNNLDLNGAGNGTASQLSGFDGKIILSGSANSNAMLFTNAAGQNVGGSLVNVTMNGSHLGSTHGGTVTLGSLSSAIVVNATASTATNVTLQNATLAAARRWPMRLPDRLGDHVCDRRRPRHHLLRQF